MCNTCLLLNAADPTRTITIRKKFVADYTRRFKRLIKDIQDTVRTNNALALRAADPGQFDFPRSADKIPAFMDWLREQTAIHVYGVTSRDRVGASIETAWQNTYLDSAYKQGIRRAKSELKGVVESALPDFLDPIQTAFNSPVHADRVGAIYTRAYSELRGITDAMDQQISRILADGLLQGYGPDKMAKAIVDRVESIGIHRATLLARTETIRAHHLATIQEYRNAGVAGVKVLAEFSTAGDGRVCPICASLNHKIYTLDEAEGIIPVHPQCRCVALPYFGEEEKPVEYQEYDGAILDTPNKIREAVVKIDSGLKDNEEFSGILKKLGGTRVKIVEKEIELEREYSTNILKELNDLQEKAEKEFTELAKIRAREYGAALNSPAATEINFGAGISAEVVEEIAIFSSWFKRSDMPSAPCYFSESSATYRAHYSNGTCHLSTGYKFAVAAHEIGHFIEENFPGALDAAIKLLRSRTTGERYEKGGEWFWPADFVTEYAARDYTTSFGVTYATELISVGLQELLTDPMGLIRRDPEHFDFLMRVFKGMK